MCCLCKTAVIILRCSPAKQAPVKLRPNGAIQIYYFPTSTASYGCWCLLCQGLGYFSQPRSLNILPDLTLVTQNLVPSQTSDVPRSVDF